MSADTLDKADIETPVHALAPTEKADLIAVGGWDNEYVPHQQRAVIINPEASDAELADWARGQFEQIGHIIAAFGQSDAANMNRVMAALSHLHVQGGIVLTALADRLCKREMSAD